MRWVTDTSSPVRKTFRSMPRIHLRIIPLMIVLAGCSRDRQLMTSDSPDGRLRITLWVRTVGVFRDRDLHATVTRDGLTSALFTHHNDFCGTPGNARVIWTGDSKAAVILVCTGLCSIDAHLYDATSNRAAAWDEAEERLTEMIMRQYPVPPEPALSWPRQNPLGWACHQIEREH